MSFWLLVLAVVLGNIIVGCLWFGAGYLAGRWRKRRVAREIAAGVTDALCPEDAPVGIAAPVPREREGELAACPYCGFRNVQMGEIPGDPEVPGSAIYFVRCDGCLASGGGRTTREGAEDTWNRVARMSDVQRL